MTDDSYELVSAYLDGQATDEEVARIEADPVLLREVAEMRAVAAELAEVVPAPDPERRDAQIAAALDLFDTLAAPADDGPRTTAPVLDLGRARTKQTEERRERATSMGKGFPTWLGAAAGLLIIAGGVGWVATQGTGDDDSAETASVAADADMNEESADAATGFRQATEAEATEAEATDESAPPTSTTAMAGGAPEAEASAPASDDAAAEDTAGEDTATEESTEEADEEGSDSGGLFPAEELERGRIIFDAPPSPEELADLAQADLFATELSVCGADVEAPTPSILVGFVPVSVEGVLGEAFIFESDPGERSTLVVDIDCQPLE